MLHAITRWAVPLIALLGVGFLAGELASSLHAPDGSSNTSFVLVTSIGQGVIACLGTIGLAAVMGMVGARWVSPRVGLLCAGLVLVWAARRTGQVDQIINLVAGMGASGAVGKAVSVSTTLYMLAAEGLVLSVLGVVLAWVIVRVPMSEWARQGTHTRPDGPPLEPSKLWEPTSLAAFAVALVAGGVMTYLFAQETIKMQTIAAAIIAGATAAIAGRLTSQTVHAAVMVGAVVLLGAIGPLVVVLGTNGTAAIVRAAQAGTMMALARPLPMDYLAGALIGVPIGLSWGNSMVEKHGVVAE